MVNAKLKWWLSQSRKFVVLTLGLNDVKLSKFGSFVEFFLLSKLQINKSIRAMELSFSIGTSIYLISLALNALRSADFNESMVEWLDTRFFLPHRQVPYTSRPSLINFLSILVFSVTLSVYSVTAKFIDFEAICLGI